LSAAWAQLSNENPLVVIQLDIFNAYPSADRQAQFDVLAGRASKSYDNWHVHMGDDIPCPGSVDTEHIYTYSISPPCLMKGMQQALGKRVCDHLVFVALNHPNKTRKPIIFHGGNKLTLFALIF